MNVQNKSASAKAPNSMSNHAEKVRIPLPAPTRSTPSGDSTGRPRDDALSADDVRKREPKYVPYEPYRAAVVPLENTVPRKVSTSNKSPSDAKHGMKAPSNLSRPCKTADRSNVATVVPLVLRRASKENETAELKKELEALRRENGELKDQLSQQTKINTELKKLLVASVGEDLETRLQFLTHDKVKLAHDVNHYIQKLMADHEELEKLSIQCDVWRSKFLASSLIVDGLANWKAVLYHRYDGALDTLQQLLIEHNKIYEQLNVTAENLMTLQNSFNLPSQCESSSGKSVLDVALLCGNLASQLRKNLIVLDSNENRIGKSERLPTAGEKHAMQILRGQSLYDPPSDYLKNVNPESCSLHSSIVHRFYPNTRFEHLTMNCCSQCRGEIQLL